MPRRYRMDARAASVEQTRRRIVEAAKILHADQGILGTSYEEIARRADVAPATVYRQFPTLSDLLPACARSIHVLQPPSPEAMARLFRDLPRPLQRLELLVRGTCDCYVQDQGWLAAAHREEALVPVLGEIIQVEQENLRLLVRAALEGTGASERLERVLVALIDFPVWQSLRRAGLSNAQAADQIVDLVRDQVSKENID